MDDSSFFLQCQPWDLPYSWPESCLQWRVKKLMSKEGKRLGQRAQIGSITRSVGHLLFSLQIHRPPSSTLLSAWEADPPRLHQWTPSLLGVGSGRSGRGSEEGGEKVRFLFPSLSPASLLDVPVSFHWRRSSSQGGLQCPHVIISTWVTENSASSHPHTQRVTSTFSQECLSLCVFTIFLVLLGYFQAYFQFLKRNFHFYFLSHISHMQMLPCLPSDSKLPENRQALSTVGIGAVSVLFQVNGTASAHGMNGCEWTNLWFPAPKLDTK